MHTESFTHSKHFHTETKPMQHSYIAFCSAASQTCMYLRTWQQNMATITQPFHCDLQLQIPKHPTTTHTWTATRCRTPWRNQKTSERAYPQRPHTRAALHRRLQPLYTEKQCLALRLPPQNQAHATFMQPLCVFCSATSQTRMYLRT